MIRTARVLTTMRQERAALGAAIQKDDKCTCAAVVENCLLYSYIPHDTGAKSTRRMCSNRRRPRVLAEPDHFVIRKV